MQRQRLANGILFLLWCVYLLIGDLWPVWVVVLDLVFRVFSSLDHSPAGAVASFVSPHRETSVSKTESNAARRFADGALLAGATGVVALELAWGQPFPATVVGAGLAMICLTDAVSGGNALGGLYSRLISWNSFAALCQSPAIVRLDRALCRWIGAPFRDRLARRRLAMVALGSMFAVLLIFGGVKWRARSLGIRTSVWFNGDRMFRPEDDIGFVNQRNLKRFNYLNVWEETNERGFKHPSPVSQKKRDGAVRIIGFGDSVMWGLGVSRDDAFMGLLDSMLDDAARYEVINAGTVHYSSVQELIFFEKRLVPLNPDIVFLNLCANDLFPTDDPFGNVRGVYVRYLEKLLEAEGRSMSDDEVRSARALIDLFGEASVWKSYRDLPSVTKEHAVKFLVERPYRLLIQAAARSDIRLVVLLIPVNAHSSAFEGYCKRLIPLFERTQTEHIDFTEALSTAGQPLFSERFSRPEFKLAFHWADLHSIQLHRQYEWKHENLLFVDESHPSRLGNRVIAERIHEFLSRDRDESVRR